MKINSAQIDKFSIAASAVCVFGGLVFSCIARSWVPLVFFSLVAIVPGAILASVAIATEVVAGKRAWDRYSTMHISITFASIAIILLGVVSVVERLVWLHTVTPPSIIIAKEYGDRYTANKHRLFKFQCESRDAMPMNIKEVGDQVFLRCGEMYPQVYTASASLKAFEKAFEETRNDPPHMSFILEKD